eukprot:275155_1
MGVPVSGRGDYIYLKINESYAAKNWKERIHNLESAMQFFKREKSNQFLFQSVKEEHQLLEFEHKMEQKEPETELIDMSVNELISHYIKTDQLKKAKSVKKKFNVPDKRFWHIHVRTLASERAWSELEKVVSSVKKPPIGFLPIAELCLKGRNQAEAIKYVKRFADVTEKLEWLCELRCWQEAAEVAASEKDFECLEMIRANCKDRKLERWITNVLK